MVKYYVNEKRKHVIAVINNCEMDVARMLSKYPYGNALITKDSFIENTYKAIAKCSPEDEFDIEVGKKIARERVIRKYNKAFDKALKNSEKVIRVANESIEAIKNRRCGTNKTIKTGKNNKD